MRLTDLVVVTLMLPMTQAQAGGGGSNAGAAFRAQEVGTDDIAESADVVVEKEEAAPEQPVPTAAAETVIEPDKIPENNVSGAAKELETNTAAEAAATEASTAAEEATPAPVPVETTAQPVEQVTAAPVTTTPALRSNDNPTISDAATNAEVSGSVREYMNQGNPLLLAGLAAICCFFLLLWGRKRRLASLNGGGSGGSSGPAAVDSGVGAVGATAATKKINSKVQYSRIDDQFEAESPFSRNHDDSDDYDDQVEDGFGQGRDKWDDWEPEDSAGDPNPFAAPVGLKFATNPVSSSSLAAVATTAPAFKLSPPPAASALTTDARSTELHEVVLSSSATSPPANSVGSNSSSDSFEVVTEESTVASPYPLFPAPAPGKSLKKPEPEEKKQSVDDLFSQFGMVPTFKKGVQQQPVAVCSSSSSPGPSSSRGTKATASGTGATTPTTTPSNSALPSAAEASAVFAAELDDLGITAAGGDWGEDDEWVKGI